MGKKGIAKAKHLHNQYENALDRYVKWNKSRKEPLKLWHVIRETYVKAQQQGNYEVPAAILKYFNVKSALSSHGKSVDEKTPFSDLLLLDEKPVATNKSHVVDDCHFVNLGRKMIKLRQAVETKARALVSYIKFGDENAIWDPGTKKSKIKNDASNEVMYAYGHYKGDLNPFARETLESDVDSMDSSTLADLAMSRMIDPTLGDGGIGSELKSYAENAAHNEFYEDFVYGTYAKGKSVSEVQTWDFRAYTDQLKTIAHLTTRLYESKVGKLFLAEQFEKQYPSNLGSDKPRRLRNTSIFPPKEILDPDPFESYVADPHAPKPLMYNSMVQRFNNPSAGMTDPNFGRATDNWNDDEFKAFLKSAINMMQGSWFYLKEYKTTTKQYFGMTYHGDGENERRNTVHTFIRGFIQRTLSKNDVKKIATKITQDIDNNAIDAETVERLASRVGIDTQGESVSSLEGSLKSKLSGIENVGQNDFDGWMDIVSIAVDKGYDAAALQNWNDMPWIGRKVTGIYGMAKIGFGLSGMYMEAMDVVGQVQNPMQSLSIDEIISFTNTIRDTIDALGAVDSVVKATPMLTSRISISNLSPVKVAGALAFFFNAYESVKNGLFAIHELLTAKTWRGVGQAGKFALVSGSMACFAYASIPSLTQLTPFVATVGSVPGAGGVILVGLGLAIAAIAATAYLSLSAFEKWCKKCYFSMDEQSDEKTPTNVEFGFKYPSDFALPDDMENTFGSTNFTMQVSSLSATKTPIGLESGGHVKYDSGAKEVELKVVPQGRLSQEGYLVVRPLNPAYEGQTADPRAYSPGRAQVRYASLKDYEVDADESDPQPPLHLLSLDSTRRAGGPDPWPSHAPVWSGNRGSLDTCSVSLMMRGDVNEATFTLSGKNPTQLLGFDDAGVKKNPIMEVSYLRRSEVSSMLNMENKWQYSWFLERQGVPREFAAVEVD